MSINPKPLISEANIHRQENTQWCYAAVIQMVLEYYGTKITQPEIVNIITGSRTNNDPQTPTDLLTKLKHTNGCYPKAKLLFKKIKLQIDSKRPIIVRLSGGSGHYVLIVGYTQDMDKGKTQLIYIDPNKNKYNVETVIAFDAITTVNTIYEVFGSGEDHDGPSDVGGFCFTKPSQDSPGSSPKGAEGAPGSSPKGAEGAPGSSPKGAEGAPGSSPKGSSSAKGAPGSAKRSSKGGMKSKKSRKSRSTRKKIRGKSRRVRK